MDPVEQAREALKLCPFCGGTNVKTFGPVGWYRTWGISHSCKSFYSGTSEMFQGFHTEAEAIAAWNRRSPASDHEIDRFGMIDEASGHEQLYWGRTNDIQPWGVSGEEYVRYSDHVAVLAGLSRVSPSTPVDGVGADPDALAYRFWSVHPKELDEWAKTAPPMPERYKGGVRAWFFACEMRSALANPEAEARLRERVENAVQAMSETHDSWEARCHAIMAGLGFDFGWDAPTQDAEARLAQAERYCSFCDVKFTEAVCPSCRSNTHARLAQAEGGPAVTDEMLAAGLQEALSVMDEHGVDGLSPFTDYPSPSETMRRVFIAMSEAALHPQSAAGEEGKP